MKNLNCGARCFDSITQWEWRVYIKLDEVKVAPQEVKNNKVGCFGLRSVFHISTESDVSIKRKLTKKSITLKAIKLCFSQEGLLSLGHN